MRRLVWWALDSAAAMSAALFMIVCGLWVSSSDREFRLLFVLRGERWEVVSSSGRLVLDNMPQQTFERRQWEERVAAAQAEVDSLLSGLGQNSPASAPPAQIRLLRQTIAAPQVHTLFVKHSVPYYLAFAAALPLPILAVLSFIDRGLLRHRGSEGGQKSFHQILARMDS